MAPSSLTPPTQCSISIKNDPQEILHFESFPASIDESYSPQWRVRTVKATTIASVLWSKGAYGPFSLALTYVAGLFANNLGRTQSVTQAQQDIELDAELKKMEEKARWLEALNFPRANTPRSESDRAAGVFSGQPPTVLITIGRFLVIEGVSDGINISWLPPFHPVSARPYRVDVRITIKRLNTFFPDFDDINAAASLRTTPNFDVIKQQRDLRRNSFKFAGKFIQEDRAGG